MRIMCMIAAVVALNVQAANMMKDPDFNQQPLLPEVHQYGPADGSKVSSYEEDATWNRCVRLDFVKNFVDKNGQTNVNVGVLFGGTPKAKGFSVTGGRKYRFSFELKGTSPYVIVIQMSWDANGKSIEQKATKLNSVNMTANDWTAYKGELETPKDAVRTALGLQVWGRGPRYAEAYTPGHYFMVDKVSFEEVTVGRDIWPARALVVPEKGAAIARDFRNWAFSDEPAHYPSEMQVASEEDCLRFSFAFSGGAPVAKATGTSTETGGGLWKEEHVELYLQRRNGGEILHLALGAAGARWMNGNDPDFGSWQAEAKANAEGWKCRVRIPWRTLGYDAKPAKGTAIRFNAMRERVIGAGEKFDPAKATRSGRGQIFDDSLFSFAGREVANPDRFGVLLLGEDEKYGEDASAWWYRNERAKEDARLAKLAREKFVVAQVPPHTNPDIPYLPPELFDPQPVFRLRGAINERVVLPLAIANMTDEMEEYRVLLTPGFDQPSPAYEQPMPMLGFRRADGTRIEMDHITMRRGVRFRDSNAPQHGKRYDVLSKMNEVSSVPVAPKEAALVWVQIDCHGLKPGVYTSEVLVTALSGGQQERNPKASTGKDGRKSYQFFDDSKRIPVTFEVLPFALSEPTDMAMQGFHLAQSPYQVAFMDQYDYCSYLVTPWFFDVKVNADGSLAEKSLRSFQKPRLDVIRNVRRIGDLPRAMVAYSAYSNFKNFHIGRNNKHIKPGTPEFWRAYREWLKFIDETMRASGFENDDYIVEIFDEPNPKQFPKEEFRQAFAEARAAVPKMRLLNTNGERNYFKGNSDLTDVWFFSQHVFGLKQCRPMPGEMLAKGGKTSLYACGTEMRQDLYRYYRLLAWKAAAFGGDYVSIYQFYGQILAANFRQGTYGEVAYDTAESVVPSIRLENLYQGMTDIRYLRLLKKTAEAKKGDPVADAALKFVETALWEVPQRYGADPTRADGFRDTCVDYLRKLTAAKSN